MSPSSTPYCVSTSCAAWVTTSICSCLAEALCGGCCCCCQWTTYRVDLHGTGTCTKFTDGACWGSTDSITSRYLERYFVRYPKTFCYNVHHTSTRPASASERPAFRPALAQLPPHASYMASQLPKASSRLLTTGIPPSPQHRLVGSRDFPLLHTTDIGQRRGAGRGGEGKALVCDPKKKCTNAPAHSLTHSLTHSVFF